MKSGIKTSEFWLGLAALLLPILGQVLEMPIVKENAIAAALLAGLYALGRAFVKGKAEAGKALVEEAKALKGEPLDVEKP
jgi:membrane protein implicated in regulation of membrane protease activity